MYLLDTNVISELRRARPHGAVLAWIRSVPDNQIYISAVTLAEIQSGIEITRDRDPRRAAELEQWLDLVASSYNILVMDGTVFRTWARLMHGKSDALYEDAMIAATARVHGFIVVTRNVSDFTVFQADVLNPFEFTSA
uniref:PIN domain-containing protein n=1 Tax=Candidatus Kentrum sp. FW TaxID=2126338 RepID=A0A450RT88_9GAMM|nr:MAG: hypothetical protein BECKFW1821A_GA0114235_100169 [Candidatus Kentron sp. FW]